MNRTPSLSRPIHRYLEAGMIALIAASRLVRMRWLLDRRGYAEAKAAAERLSQRRSEMHIGPVGTAVIVHRVASFAPRPLNCLPQALTLWSLTRASGHPTELKIGVAPRTQDGQRMNAHAWVELDGRALDESTSRYVTMPVEGQLPTERKRSTAEVRAPQTEGAR